MTILAVYREFGSLAQPEARLLDEGVTLGELRRQMRCLPHDFDARGIICVNGHPVYRSAWDRITPKPEVNGVPVEITFHAPPMGGGRGERGGGGKNVFAIVAGIALTALTGFIGAGGLATKLGFSARLFGAGTIGATLAAAGVSLAGSLLLAGLVPPPTIPTARGGQTLQNAGPASASGNVLEPNAPVPRVVGERKVFPPLACEPLTYFDGADEVVEAMYILAGPHRLQDIRIGAAPIAELDDVEFETREGLPGDARITMIRRQGRTEGRNTELRGHTVNSDDGVTLESPTGDLATAVPQRMTVVTREAPDEHQLHLVFPAGLNRNASDTDRLRVPIRLRIRLVGTTVWQDLPELHFSAATPRQLRATIRLIWTANATTTPAAAATEGWVEAHRFAPAQTVSPVGAGLETGAYFLNALPGTENFLNASNLATSRVDHVVMSRWSADFYLDTAVFPRGRYEIEIRRGMAVLNTDWSSSAYTVAGTVYDLFGSYSTPRRIRSSRNGVADSVVLVRSVSIWNEHPLPTDDFAVIAVRARNRQMDQVSVLAGGYVPDWDGTGWTGRVVTSNPAPHLRHILTGGENLDPVPQAVIDEAELVAWRTDCAAKGYQCNALIEDGSVDDALRITASCGYARPYMSEVWGVIRDRDRSADAPVQVFTPRNSSNFQWTKTFARPPEGFRVNFRDAARDYEARQITVFRPGVSSDTGRLEQVTYEGLVTEAEVRAKALYDQAQTDLRDVFYTLDAPAEAIVCRRGSLVGVQHDSLEEQSGSGRVIDIAHDASGNIIALQLDGRVPVQNETDLLSIADLLAVPDIATLGARSGALIRRAASRTTHALTNASGLTDTLTFSPGISPTGIGIGTLVSTGPLAREVLRLIVFAIEPRADLTATLTLVDEASGATPDLTP
jgi:hypothetical protein